VGRTVDLEIDFGGSGSKCAFAFKSVQSLKGPGGRTSSLQTKAKGSLRESFSTVSQKLALKAPPRTSGNGNSGNGGEAGRVGLSLSASAGWLVKKSWGIIHVPVEVEAGGWKLALEPCIKGGSDLTKVSVQRANTKGLGLQLKADQMKAEVKAKRKSFSGSLSYKRSPRSFSSLHFSYNPPM